jgi:hypothetical protein
MRPSRSSRSASRVRPPDVRVFTTTLQIAAAIAVAGLGTVYLALLDGQGPSHAFGIVTALLALGALIAAALAYRATHTTPLTIGGSPYPPSSCRGPRPRTAGDPEPVPTSSSTALSGERPGVGSA